MCGVTAGGGFGWCWNSCGPCDAWKLCGGCGGGGGTRIILGAAWKPETPNGNGIQRTSSGTCSTRGGSGVRRMGCLLKSRDSNWRLMRLALDRFRFEDFQA